MVDTHVTRRQVLAGIGASTVAGLAGCTGNGGESASNVTGGGGGNDLSEIGTARLSTGSTSLVAPVITEKGWDEANGFTLNTVVRNSVSAYYGDFVSGTYNTLPFGVSSAASRYNKGVDMKLFAGFDYSSMFWLTNSPDIEVVADFEGKTVAAPLSAGSYQVANAVVNRKTGRTIEQLAGNLVNATGPGSSLQEVATGNATVALSWEPALSTFLVENEGSDIHTIVNVREQYKRQFNAESFHLVWAVKSDILENNRNAIRGLLTANQEVDDLYTDNVDEALDIVVENTENKRAPLEEALKSNRQEFVLNPLESIRPAVQTQFEVFADRGIIEEVPDDGIYADIQPK